MNILIIEDDLTKAGKVAGVAREYFRDAIEKLEFADSMASATKAIYEREFDLIITDLLLPPRTPDVAIDLSDQITATIQDSKFNRAASIIAVSGFSDIIEERRRYFSDLGMFLVEYKTDDDSWIPPLKMCFQRVEVKTRYSFIVFCALEKERTAYKAVNGAVYGDDFLVKGLNCTNIQLGPHRGLCIKMPRAGLVDAAIIASKAINLFSPKVVAISGICAGVAGETDIGNIVAGSFAWEYQVGKWSVEDFKMEPYQVHLRSDILDELEIFVGKDKLGLQFKDNTFSDRTIRNQEVVIGPFASGSAVIADPARVNGINSQQRKMAAIDMEMHSIYRACDLSAERPAFFGVKTVVDLADQNKGDEHHINGSITSARFACSFIKQLLDRRD
ncbi:hypothetical protein [Rhizobium chutanense]|uniref:Nucleoside phosphorylase domain-containing protein n=1 Tax=Rhizobium chutanense TaxID=2035448 RepID=A0A3S0S162_9HYPH|nr:hypothetical protein [Rhizobium chutanense]RUL97746.1 hypothetical protein EFR84_30055 [Rhizobium chutanense]